jgi:hypothetical protein
MNKNTKLVKSRHRFRLRIDTPHRFADDRKNAFGAGELMDEAQIIQRVGALRTEHRDLDSAIDALRLLGSSDQLQIARLKKRKLALRDEIAMLEDQLIPDIIA